MYKQRRKQGTILRGTDAALSFGKEFLDYVLRHKVMIV